LVIQRDVQIVHPAEAEKLELEFKRRESEVRSKEAVSSRQ
jgi:hypothetical protein